MPQAVVDHSSNVADTVAHAAKIVGKGAARRAVFMAIYKNKKQVRTVKEIAKMTHLSEMRVLQEGRKLFLNHIVGQTKVGRSTAYERIGFYHARKKKILDLGASSKKLAAFPTKVNPGGRARGAAAGKSIQVEIRLRIPKIKHRAEHVTVDDIDNFAAVKKIGSKDNVEMLETPFKNGVAAILGEKGQFKDWGGESRDLSTTRLKINSKRRIAAFAFKGPGKKGRLTPGKMGKNGDQIQRLVRCDAEVFIVQYWAEIDDAVIEQLKALVTLKSYLEDEKLWWGIMDGNDSARLIAAYPKKFGSKK
jgi:hypothetical protein